MVLDAWTIGVLVYVSGVVAGTILGDAQPVTRIGLALLWPVGPLAFAVTIGILLAASLIAFPAIGATLIVLGILLWVL